MGCGKARALVSGASPVLVGQCRRSNGGLWYNDQRTFIEALDVVTSETGELLGRQGAQFFRDRYEHGNIPALRSKNVRHRVQAVVY